MMKIVALFSRTDGLFVGAVLTLALGVLLTLAGCRAGGKNSRNAFVRAIRPKQTIRQGRDRDHDCLRQQCWTG